MAPPIVAEQGAIVVYNGNELDNQGITYRFKKDPKQSLLGVVIWEPTSVSWAGLLDTWESNHHIP